MKDKSLLYANYRLNQWAKWFSRRNPYGLGFPEQSIEYRLMTEGILINSTAPREIPSNHDAEETEVLVKLIEKENIKIGRSLRSQYFDKLPSREKAKNLNISYAQFRNYIDKGKYWLAGRLSLEREN